MSLIAPWLAAAGRAKRRLRGVSFRSAVAGWSLVLLLASLVQHTLRTVPAVARVGAEWPLLLIGWQVVGLAAILACVRPRSRRDWLALAMWSAVPPAVAVLYVIGRFDHLVYWGAHAGFRLAIGGAWTLAVVGTPFVAFWVWQRGRGANRPFPLARWWFSAVVLLATAEPLAILLQPGEPEEAPLAFPQSLPPPPDGEWHLASIGGSTTAGWPYFPHFSIPQVAAWRLEQAVAGSRNPGADESGSSGSPRSSRAALEPRPRVVVHNLARAGENLRWAIRRLHELEYRPHVLLVYSGHNEFYHELEEVTRAREGAFAGVDRWLRLSPAFRAVEQRLTGWGLALLLRSPRLRQLIDVPLVPPEQEPRRLKRFRRQLEQLAAYCRASGIDTVWFVPAGSEATFDPNRSIVAPGTRAADRAEIERLYRAALSLERAGRLDDAAELYRQGLERQPRFAEFHFRLGAVRHRQQRYAEAREHYALALESDGHPVRARADYRQQVAQVAAAHGIPWIDAESVLRPRTPHGILDESVFHDSVHPTLRAFFWLGIEAAERIARELDNPFEIAGGDPAVFESAVADLGIGVAELAQAYEVTAETLRWLGYQRFDPSERQRRAAVYDERARRLRAEEIRPGEAGTERL